MTEIELKGPGTASLMAALAKLLEVAAEACTAYTMTAVASMKAKEVELTELHRKRQRLESEVKQLEERKKKALIPAAVAKPVEQHKAALPPQQHMRSNTKPLTPEQMALAQVKAEEAAAVRKAEAEAKRQAPLTHSIKGLEEISAKMSTSPTEA